MCYLYQLPRETNSQKALKMKDIVLRASESKERGLMEKMQLSVKTGPGSKNSGMRGKGPNPKGSSDERMKYVAATETAEVDEGG